MTGGRLLAITLTTILVAVSWPLGRGAAAEPEPTVVQVSSMPVKDKRGKEIPGQYWVLVTLTTETGRYVAKRPVKIVEPVDFFGRREASLGTAVTDGTGLTGVVYQPSQPGLHQIVVRFAGDDEFAASSAKLALDVATAIPAFTREAPPLESVGRWLSVFLALLGVAFWAVLLGVLGVTAWRIRTAPGATADVAPAAAARR